MKIKGVPYSQIRAKALENPAVLAAYLAEQKEEELHDLLLQMRDRAGLNSTQVAERMGISQPAISKLERNAAKASISTLERYAAACGVTLKISMA
ncbi:helix-turn-helix domain-containing protein [Erwinia mallotivora]|uniref:helix-turn-helix domain-containing protein n=1 Tax=Erwinia mallotivora TaxID=69222 RepID=UPI0035E571C2